MKIFGSTQYVDLEQRKEVWYQLEVINMWDWSTPAICYDYVGKTLISYALHLNTPKSSNSWESKIITELTDEMKETLVSMGYSIK